jgi:hypothetical protein
MIKVFTKSAIFDHRLQIPMSSRDDANITLVTPAAPQAASGKATAGLPQRNHSLGRPRPSRAGRAVVSARGPTTYRHCSVPSRSTRPPNHPWKAPTKSSSSNRACCWGRLFGLSLAKKPSGFNDQDVTMLHCAEDSRMEFLWRQLEIRMAVNNITS